MQHYCIYIKSIFNSGLPGLGNHYYLVVIYDDDRNIKLTHCALQQIL